MKETRKSEVPRFKEKYRLLCTLSVMLPLLFVFSGCQTISRQPNEVVTTWRGNLIDEERINEKSELGAPTLIKVDWNKNSGAIDLFLQQYRIANYDLKKQYEKMQIVRFFETNPISASRCLGRSSVFLQIMSTGQSKRADDKTTKERMAAIAKLKAGQTVANANIYFVNWPGGKPVMRVVSTSTYRRELADADIETSEPQQEQGMVSAKHISIKLVGLNGSQSEYMTESDDSGWASFPLAKKPSDAIALKPRDWKIFAQWDGQWLELGTAKLTKERISKITEGLKKKSIAAEGIPTLPPFAKLSVTVPDTEVKADTDCELSLTVENTGKGEFYKLVATSESLVPELDGLKFEFGKLEPGDELTLTQKVHIPRGQLTGPANVNFKWSELNGYEPDPVYARIMVRGLPRPQFAVSVQVLDDNTGNSVGNGDGRIQKGEAVDLLVTVKNIGDGDARDVKVKIDDISASGVIVNISEQSLGEITTGQSKQARLTITTKKSAKIDKLTPTIKVIDQYLDIEQKEQLALALESELAPSIMAYKTTIYVGEEEVAIRGGAGDETAIIARAKPGSSLQATGELGQWMRVELPQIGTGWVNRSMIAFEPTFQSTVTAQVSGGIVEILQKAPPLIAVAKPLSKSKFKSSHVEVSGVIADDQAVSRTEFKLNGRGITFNDKRAIGIEAGNQAGAKRELNFAFPVELALGENEIEIVAWDNEGLTSSKVISVSYEKEKGNIYIACIGIDKYKNIPRLKYATADAQTMAQYLQKSLSVPEENVYVLLNEQATLTNIKNTLGVKIRQRAGKSDMVIIYFSGHGAPEADPHSPDNDGVNKYLLPIEAERDALYATALPMDEVRNIFRRLISERVIFLADTCYSGAAGGRTLMPSGTQYRSVNQDNLLARLRDTGKGRVILTASQGSEVSQEKDDLGHGVFTYFLLRGLDGKADRNGDNTITISELYEYVSKEVSKETKNTQHPMMKLDEMVGEVVISVLEGK